MSLPSVCAIMLTRDRPEMAARAVRCFRAQTYDPAMRFLLVYDTGDPSWYDPRSDSENEVHWTPVAHRLSIGAMRNAAIEAASRSDIIVHWDDDDISHPRRIEEQVAFLQSSGADCVGYNRVLFWRGGIWRTGACDIHHAFEVIPEPGERVVHCPKCGRMSPVFPAEGESWLYHNGSPKAPIGASFCYWRRVWEKHPFKDDKNEDWHWRQVVECASVGGCRANIEGLPANVEPVAYLNPEDAEPRLICTLHGGNTTVYDPAAQTSNWTRTPEWDARVREIVEAA